MKNKIPLFDIYYDHEEIDAITKTIKSGIWSGEGEEVKNLEKEFTDYIGTKYAAALNSGTSTLHSLLLAYGISSGDEVITTPFTFIATSNSALFVGAKPVFVDIEEENYGIDPYKINDAITDKTKAIMPIHYGGIGCKIKEIREIAKDNNIILIEDAAEALGATVNGEKIGTFGDSSSFSLCANKNITSGEGGLITTDSKEVYEKVKLIRSHGRSETNLYDHMMIGYNFRMSNITAAIARVQVKKVEEINEMRIRNARYLTEKLSKIEGIETLKEPQGYKSIFQLYTIRLKNETIRNKLMKYLSENGIHTKIYFPPVHLTTFYRNLFRYKGGEFPVAENLSKRVLSLPMFPALNKE
ncbi:MAG: aminotransferase DegT, partial [Candidatus Altiarchaeales archaeon A3]